MLVGVETFVRAVEDGSFDAAAKKLGVPRSTVSRRIARLESTLGVQLFARTTRARTLTEDGRKLYDEVAPALQRIADATQTARAAADEPQGTLRVTAPVDIGGEYLPAIIAEMLLRHPDVDIELDLSARTVDLVAEGFDLAIRAGALADSSLVVKKLDELTMILVASPAYVARMGLPERPADLVRHDFIVLARAGTQRLSLQADDGEHIAAEVRPRLTVNSLTFVISAVAAGIGVGLAPESYVASAIAAGALVHVLPSYSGKGGGLHLITPAGRTLPKKTRVFRALVVERLASKPWRTR